MYALLLYVLMARIRSLFIVDRDLNELQNRAMSLNFTFLIAALFIVAGSLCFGDIDTQPAKHPTGIVSRKLRDCQRAQDCIAIQEGPCSCESGGKIIAVRKHRKKYWEDMINSEQAGC